MKNDIAKWRNLFAYVFTGFVKVTSLLRLSKRKYVNMFGWLCLAALVGDAQPLVDVPSLHIYIFEDIVINAYHINLYVQNQVILYTIHCCFCSSRC